MVTKFELPKVQDSEFATVPYDAGCKQSDAKKSYGRYPIGLIDEVNED